MLKENNNTALKESLKFLTQYSPQRLLHWREIEARRVLN